MTKLIQLFTFASIVLALPANSNYGYYSEYDELKNVVYQRGGVFYVRRDALVGRNLDAPEGMSGPFDPRYPGPYPYSHFPY